MKDAIIKILKSNETGNDVNRNYEEMAEEIEHILNHPTIPFAQPSDVKINDKINELFDIHGTDNGRYVAQEIAKWVRNYKSQNK